MHPWISLKKASDAGIWCFLWSTPDQTAEPTSEAPVIWVTMTLIMTSLLHLYSSIIDFILVSNYPYRQISLQYSMTLRPRYFANYIFGWIFPDEGFVFWIRFNWNLHKKIQLISNQGNGMVYSRPGKMPLPKPVTTQFTDAYICPKTSLASIHNLMSKYTFFTFILLVHEFLLMITTETFTHRNGHLGRDFTRFDFRGDVSI